jgi:serine protease Do
MNEEERNNKQQKNHRLGLIAAFIAVALIFSAATGWIVYISVRGQPASGNTPATTATIQTTEQTNAGQSSSDAANSSQSGKNFSLESAAARTDTDRQPLSITEIVAHGKPAVVAIDTETEVATPFGMNSIVPAAGSGFIISADGYIVTNDHVIDGAQSIQVTLDNGKSYPAKLVGADQLNDLAVLKIDAQNLPTVTLGNSSDLEVGELAVAIGNPLGKLSGT